MTSSIQSSPYPQNEDMSFSLPSPDEEQVLLARRSQLQIQFETAAFSSHASFASFPSFIEELFHSRLEEYQRMIEKCENDPDLESNIFFMNDVRKVYDELYALTEEESVLREQLPVKHQKARSLLEIYTKIYPKPRKPTHENIPLQIQIAEAELRDDKNNCCIIV